MKCSIMLPFIRVCTVKVKRFFIQKNKIFLKIKPDRYIQWTIPILLYQTRSKNLLVYKGSLNHRPEMGHLISFRISILKLQFVCLAAKHSQLHD